MQRFSAGALARMRFEWLDRRDDGRAQRALLWPLTLSSLLYCGAARSHRWLYESGALSRRRLPCAVVSVGSLTVGGAGKTPVTAWLARSLARRGHRVAIASRGYGRAGRDRVTVVSDGSRICSDVQNAGDEAMLLAAHVPEAPVLVARDRGMAGLKAISTFGTRVLVLDDALQHHRLERDIEIVLFDGRFGIGNGYVLPRGPLRESLGAVRGADAIGVLDAELPQPDAAALSALAPSARRFRARRRAVSVRMLGGGPSFSADALSGAKIGALSGIGSPAAFRRTLEALGALVVAERRFGDHHRYRRGDLAGLTRHVPVWVTTEKDAIKLRPEWVRGMDVRVLRIELEVDEGDDLLNWLDARLEACGAGHRPAFS
jgi:tetraacyldisaccharide 4'-kinase